MNLNKDCISFILFPLSVARSLNVTLFDMMSVIWATTKSTMIWYISPDGGGDGGLYKKAIKSLLNNICDFVYIIKPFDQHRTIFVVVVVLSPFFNIYSAMRFQIFIKTSVLVSNYVVCLPFQSICIDVIRSNWNDSIVI